MSSITFRALIDGVHYNPQKGIVKIQLVANRISLDELIAIGPKDESVQVTLENEQTNIDVFPLNPDVGNGIATIDEEGTAWPTKADQQLRGVREDEEIITEFPTEEAGEKSDDD